MRKTRRARGQRSTLARKLTRLRADRDLTVREVARRAELSPDMVKTLEGRNPRRETQPWMVSVRTAVLLCSVFAPELTLADFLPPHFVSRPSRLTRERPAA